MCQLRDDVSTWLAERALSLVVELNIRKSRYVGAPIVRRCAGLEDVLSSYQWKSAWVGSDGREHRSGDWATTKSSLARLRGDLVSAIDADHTSLDDVRDAALRVVAWGGGSRSKDKGAERFLTEKYRVHQLREYLRHSRAILHEVQPEDPRLREIESMNAMMSKVHAMLATDGLPIYDSRVAGALGSLIELYRRESGARWSIVPDIVRFPATDPKRSVRRAFSDSVDPGHIRYNDTRIQIMWASAMLKARNLLRATLEKAPALFASEGDLPSRMRAFEAALFMIGASLGSLVGHRRIP